MSGSVANLTGYGGTQFQWSPSSSLSSSTGQQVTAFPTTQLHTC